MPKLPDVLWASVFRHLPTIMVRRVMVASRELYHAGQLHLVQQSELRFLYQYFTTQERHHIFVVLSAGSERKKQDMWAQLKKRLLAYRQHPELPVVYQSELDYLLTAPLMVREACLPENKYAVSLWNISSVSKCLQQQKINIIPYFKMADLATRLTCMKRVLSLVNLETGQALVQQFWEDYRTFVVPVAEATLPELSEAVTETLYSIFAKGYKALLVEKIKALNLDVNLENMAGFEGTITGFQEALIKGDVRLGVFYIVQGCFAEPMATAPPEETPTLGEALLINALLDKGKSALHLAVSHGCLDLVRVLVLAGADLNVRTDAGQSAAHLAANTKYSADILRVLERYGLALGMPDDNGHTPLQMMAFYGNLAGAQVLLEFPLALNSADCNGNTAIHYARQYKHPQIEAVLLQHGAKPLPIIAETTPVKPTLTASATAIRYSRRAQHPLMASTASLVAPNSPSKVYAPE